MDDETTRATWDDWMVAYRFGAFYVLPPENVRRLVDPLRAHYDARSASYCTAHVSVSEPVRAPLTHAQIGELTTALGGIAPFEMTYGPLRDCAPHPGVTLAIAPATCVAELRRALHATSVYEGVAPVHSVVAPHLTVAEFISLERSREILGELSSELLTGTFWCDHVVFCVPDESFVFAPLLTVPLGASTSLASALGLPHAMDG